jgi:putative ABC transport system permease protein
MISLSHCFKMATSSLKSSKLRSGLTALGIIIGIAAVIATFTLGSSFTGYFTEQLDTQGSNYIVAFSFQQNLFFDSHVDVVRNTPGVTGVAVEVLRTGGVTFAGEQRNLSIAGTQEAIMDVWPMPMYEGRMFFDRESYVVVIGRDIAQDEFRNEIGLRSNINITLFNSRTGEHVTETFRVIGIIGGDDSLFADFENMYIAIPIHTMQRMTGDYSFSAIYATSDARETIHETSAEIERRLARSLGVSERDLDYPERIPFIVMNQAELVDMVGSLMRTLQMFLMAIGGISLVVGAVGIMNIMVVTVTERTREIGTLKALGYSSKDILLLFVVESIIISLIGGMIGTAIGIFIAFIGASMLGFPMTVPLSAVLFGVGLSVVIGVLAGAQPAYRAAKMDPVEALRSI